MKHYLQQFLLILAGATDKELAKQVQYLREENRILRDRLPKRIQVTPQERSRLLKFGREVGSAIKSLIIIVTPQTFLLPAQEELFSLQPACVAAARTTSH